MAPSTNGNTMSPSDRTTPATSTTTTEEHLQEFWSRYEQLKNNDLIKNALFEDVLTRYEYLSRTHQEYVAEHHQEREMARNVNERQVHLTDNINQLQRILNRDPFILVLIDGDGMLFAGQFMALGEEGGRQAAGHLCNRVAEWAHASIHVCPADVKVVVRIYANLQGLAHVCAKTGIVTHPSKVEEFARGFTRGKTLCDFTDVGPGKDRADGKIGGESS